MIVDTSAVLAIALQEPGWGALFQRAIKAPELLMSCGTLQELSAATALYRQCFQGRRILRIKKTD